VKSQDWIDARGAAGWNAIGEDGDDGQDERRAAEAHRVGWRHVKSARTSRVTRKAPALPRTIQTGASRTPGENDQRQDALPLAPSATRTPNSCVRCATEYEITP
jgi:hypothetical protein